MFSFNIFKQNSKNKTRPSVSSSPKIPDIPKLLVNFTSGISQEEREIAAIISSAIISSNHPNSQVRITNIEKIDLDKEKAAIIIAAIMANNSSDSRFKLHSITEINH
ncbi:hypothetical protein [Jeotgalibaca sp. A122]|uniref:hypothetical protein n=1 Tax=Jeotgalibaca sp. A122 TaxID=3457322 RepID=UPI003FD4CBC1